MIDTKPGKFFLSNEPPRLMLITSTPAPFGPSGDAAYMRPSRTLLPTLDPLAPSTFTATRVTLEVTPAAASALLLTVAPTWVPWKCRSIQSGCPGKFAATRAASPGTKFREAAMSTRPCRSRWV